LILKCFTDQTVLLFRLLSGSIFTALAVA